jgi:hypothetical protein
MANDIETSLAAVLASARTDLEQRIEDTRVAAEQARLDAATARAALTINADNVPSGSPLPEKRSFLKTAFTAVRPFLNRTTLVIALSLASAFGVVAPEKATQLRDIVMMLPQGTGDLVN